MRPLCWCRGVKIIEIRIIEISQNEKNHSNNGNELYRFWNGEPWTTSVFSFHLAKNHLKFMSLCAYWSGVCLTRTIIAANQINCNENIFFSFLSENSVFSSISLLEPISLFKARKLFCLLKLYRQIQHENNNT